jgi:hypothetical protein
VRRESAATAPTPVFGVWNKQVVAGDVTDLENNRSFFFSFFFSD